MLLLLLLLLFLFLFLFLLQKESIARSRATKKQKILTKGAILTKPGWEKASRYTFAPAPYPNPDPDPDPTLIKDSKGTSKAKQKPNSPRLRPSKHLEGTLKVTFKVALSPIPTPYPYPYPTLIKESKGTSKAKRRKNDPPSPRWKNPRKRAKILSLRRCQPFGFVGTRS